MRVFAVAMQKGGVGKTTLATNVAVVLADRGFRVLLIDADPQRCQADALRVAPPDDRTLCEVLLGQLPLAEAVIPVRGLHLLPASKRLTSVEKILGDGRPDANFRLREALKGADNAYDFVFVDCPPNLGHLTINALAAADCPLVPVQTEQGAANAFSDFLETYRMVKEYLNPRLEAPIIIPSMYQSGTILQREILEILQGNPLNLQVWQPIRRTIKIAEAYSRGIPVCDHDREASGPFEAIAARIAP